MLFACKRWRNLKHRSVSHFGSSNISDGTGARYTATWTLWILNLWWKYKLIGNYSWNFVDPVSWKSLLVAFLKIPLQCIHADPPFLSYTVIIIQNFLWFIYLYDLKCNHNVNTITTRSQYHDRMASKSVYVFKSSSTWVKANKKFCLSTHSYKDVYIWSLASKDKTICKLLRTGKFLAWVNLYVLI